MFLNKTYLPINIQIFFQPQIMDRFNHATHPADEQHVKN